MLLHNAGDILYRVSSFNNGNVIFDRGVVLTNVEDVPPGDAVYFYLHYKEEGSDAKNDTLCPVSCVPHRDPRGCLWQKTKDMALVAFLEENVRSFKRVVEACNVAAQNLQAISSTLYDRMREEEAKIPLKQKFRDAKAAKDAARSLYLVCMSAYEDWLIVTADDEWDAARQYCITTGVYTESVEKTIHRLESVVSYEDRQVVYMFTPLTAGEGLKVRMDMYKDALDVSDMRICYLVEPQ